MHEHTVNGKKFNSYICVVQFSFTSAELLGLLKSLGYFLNRLKPRERAFVEGGEGRGVRCLPTLRIGKLAAPDANERS